MSNINSNQEYYNPDELVSYLSRAKSEGFVPSFTDRPEILEAEGDKAFGVGVRKTAEGKWEQYQSKQDAVQLTGQPSAQLDAELPSTGSFTADQVRRWGMERVQLEDQQRQLVASVMGPMNAELERLGNSNAVLANTITRFSANSPSRAQYTQQLSDNTAIYGNAIQQRNVLLESIKTKPEYLALQTQIAMLKEKEEDYGPIATAELNSKTQLQQDKTLAEQRSEQEKEIAMKDIPTSIAKNTQLVLETADEVTARYRRINDPDSIPPAAEIVIQKAAENQDRPDLNSPLANLAAPSEQFHYWGQRYIHTMPLNDISARTSGKALISRMQATKAGAQERLQKAIRDDDIFTSFRETVEAFPNTNASRASPEYLAAAQQAERRKAEVVQEFFTESFMKPLKDTLFATNEDLLVVPNTVVPADAPIADAIIAGILESKRPTLDEAIVEFESKGKEELKAAGYTSAQIEPVKRQVLGTYMESINSRHKASGIQLTAADIQYTPTLWQRFTESFSSIDGTSLPFDPAP